MEEDAIIQPAASTTAEAPQQKQPSIVNRLQNEITTNSFDPTKYNEQQLGVINQLLQQGVLKGPPLDQLVQTFQTTREKIAKEKEYNLDPIAYATKDKSLLEGELTALVPGRAGTELIGSTAGGIIPFVRNQKLLEQALAQPKGAQVGLFAEQAGKIARAIEETPGLGKRLKFTTGILTGAAKAADWFLGAEKTLAKTQLQSIGGSVLGAGAAIPTYDLVNRSFGKDIAVAINSDLANIPNHEVDRDTTMATLEAMKNTAYWSAAGTALNPVIGMFGSGARSLFGLKGEKALELAQYANEKGLPVPLVTGMDGGLFSYFGKTFFKTIGIFPFVSRIGDQALRQAEEAVGKAYLADLHNFAPVMKTSALSTASFDQIQKNFEKHANLISANYAALMNKVDDIGNPAIIQLTKGRTAASEFINEFKQSIPKLEGVGGQYSMRKEVYDLTEQGDPIYQLMDILQGSPNKPFTFKEYAGLQRMLTKAIQKTQFFDVRKSLFSLREGLENDLAESFGKLNVETILKDPTIKTTYDGIAATSGKAAADAYVQESLQKATQLNTDLKTANTIFSKTLSFYNKNVARELKVSDKYFFTNKQLNGITGAESTSPTQLFNTIEKNVFRSGDVDALEQLKGLYGYNTSKEGKEMFNRAFNRYMYDNFVNSFNSKTYAPGGLLDAVDKVVLRNPKSTIASDVVDKLGQSEFAAGREFGVKEALDGKGNEVINIKWGKDNYAEFSADKFSKTLGLQGDQAAERTRFLVQAYGGGEQGRKAVEELRNFVKYTAALESIPISETSSFIQRRLTLGGAAAITGAAAATLGGGGLFHEAIFLLFSRSIGKALTDPTALRYMMDALQPAERAAMAAKQAGVKKVFGVPVTVGEDRARAFARFANYMHEQDNNLPSVNPKNVNPQEVIDRLKQIPLTVPKQGFKYSSLSKQERERMFPEIEFRQYASPAANVQADAFSNAYTKGTRQALTALNIDHGVAQPKMAATAEQAQVKQQANTGLQPPSVQPLQAPQTQQGAKGQQYAGLFPFDVLGQQIAGRQG